MRDLEDKLLDNLLFRGIVGRSPAMLEVFDLAKKIARHLQRCRSTNGGWRSEDLRYKVNYPVNFARMYVPRFGICPLPFAACDLPVAIPSIASTVLLAPRRSSGASC
jgi:hypothetical protein